MLKMIIWLSLQVLQKAHECKLAQRQEWYRTSSQECVRESQSVPLAYTTKKERPEIERHNSLQHLLAGVCWGMWWIFSLSAVRSLAGKHSLSAAGGMAGKHSMSAMKTYWPECFRKLWEQHAIRKTWQERTGRRYGRTGDLTYRRHGLSTWCQAWCCKLWQPPKEHDPFPTIYQKMAAETKNQRGNNVIHNIAAWIVWE